MTFLSQASPGLLAALAVLASAGAAVILFLIVSAIMHLAKWRKRKVQEVKDQINTAQKALLAVEKEKYDCQKQVTRLETYRDNLLRTICRLDAAVDLKLKIYRKYGENIQDLSQKVEDLEAAIKEKEDKIRKTIMIEIEIGSEKRRVSI